MSDKLEKFTSASLRGPQRGIYQQLLAGLLVKASTSNDFLVKVSSICEAAMMSKNKDKLNIDLIETAYSIATSFINTEVEKGRLGGEVVRVAWDFPMTKGNWEKYIQPWHKVNLRFYPLETFLAHQNFPLKSTSIFSSDIEENARKATNSVVHSLSEMSPHEEFWERTSALTKGSFSVLEAEFCRWILPKLFEVQATISEEVDPKVYSEVFGFMAARKEEGESEGPMGPG